MFKSQIYRNALSTLRGLQNATSGLTARTSRISTVTARNLAIAILLGCVCASGQTFTQLYSFGSNPNDGVDPQAGVVFDNAGNLYGTASVGGINNHGTVFELSRPASPGPWTETVPRQFHTGPGGNVPEGRLIVAPTGELFGTTLQGGANNAGIAYMLLPPVAPGDRWRERVLYSFGNFPGDGVNPNAGLLAGNNVLYGVASGGANFTGAVFQLTPPSVRGKPWTETVLYSFTGFGSVDAAFPSSELIMDRKGNLYGTALLGGANILGAVYQLSPPAGNGSWTEKVIFSFSGTDGSSPAGHLLLDASGTLFGTADGGGASGSGAVFQLVPPAAPGGPWTQTVLYSFSGGVDGSSPAAGVILGKNGRLFGTAQHGGNGGPKISGGVVFALDPPAIPGGPWNETVLYAFGGPDGFLPASTLKLRGGILYGTTAEGGTFGTGTVFALKP
jgi:uncharacterized repeat protein (TIGR03803 family)